MKISKRFIISTIIFALSSFLLSRVIWPDAAGAHMPSASLLPFFIFLAIVESLAFGIGMSLLIDYWEAGKKDQFACLAIVWPLISWRPHDNLHRVIDESNYVHLLFIEYGFHLTLIIAGFVLARYVMKNWMKS